jgi:Cu/Ag efflux pump CusA
MEQVLRGANERLIPILMTAVVTALAMRYVRRRD